MKNTTKICGFALALTCGLAGALKAQDIYVVNNNNNTVGEYGLDGSEVDTPLVSNLNDPWAIAISGNDLFVANEDFGGGNGSVSEYTTSGALVDASLISGLDGPYGIAVTPEPSTVALAGLGVGALWLWRRKSFGLRVVR
ncbi:MAG TPA: PEP-CTERM sorting domain-containing protein [Candidatus Sulfotelmatobacter sp.]|nr:PEP-CTERM sorting domain-containing protein [Candidatus Sulfotelmatobacter sp.]